jgi:2-dehydropantoate 2-reductase
MRILVIGAGAVGGYFGGRLQAAGRDVTFLVRERRAEELRQTGLQIFGPTGDVLLTPKLLTAAELHARPEAFDVVLLSTKAYSLDAAMEDFAPAVGAETMILPLLNGMSHLDMLSARFGGTRVLGGSTRISADLDEQGHVHSFETLHDLNYGERDKSVTPRIQALDALLRDAGFDEILRPDIIAFMWNKWTFLSALAATTCMMRGSIGDIARVPGGVQLELAMLAESTAIATAHGYAPPAEFLTACQKRFTDPASDLTASMYRDMTRGFPVEVEHILGELLLRGAAKGVATPLLKAAYVQLSVYEALRQAQSHAPKTKA